MKLYKGDCLKIMKDIPSDSVDAVVTDPPYGWAFMGKKWDYNVPEIAVWEEVCRVLKPGGFLLCCAGNRTYHRIAVNIEDAGFNIRDQIIWIYGTGLPKSHNISKALDRMAGAERKVGENKNIKGRKDGGIWGKSINRPWKKRVRSGKYDNASITAPATPDAEKWEGYGTGLKPAHESIIVAMKPVDGTFAANALKWGCGGLNIDGSRIKTDEKWQEKKIQAKPGTSLKGSVDGYLNSRRSGSHPKGRYPSNILFCHHPECARHGEAYETNGCHPDCAVRYLEEQGDECMTVVPTTRYFKTFHYCPKAAKAEKNAGQISNTHPTVKPLRLMRYLVRLVLPPGGGVIIDPFMGSGTTGVACRAEGADFIGIEKELEYFKIARMRNQG